MTLEEIIDKILDGATWGYIRKPNGTPILKEDVKQQILSAFREAVRHIDRIEVIDETGRVYAKGSIYGTPVKVQLDFQDDDRTLKVFVENIKLSDDDTSNEEQLCPKDKEVSNG